MKRGAPQHAPRRSRVIPLIVFHGDRDKTVATVNADPMLDQWLQAVDNGPGTIRKTTRDAKMQRGQVVGGHAYTPFIYHYATPPSILKNTLAHHPRHAF